MKTFNKLFKQKMIEIRPNKLNTKKLDTFKYMSDKK
jgi:hypothetical protein